MSSWINTSHTTRRLRKMGRGSEESGGDYINIYGQNWWLLAAAVVDLAATDEDGGRSHSEETNGVAKARGVEGVGR
jgi:hypothetical protein